MIEKERFGFGINANGQVDIVDWVESKEKNAICIYNDLGVLPFTSAKALCDLLNDYDSELQMCREKVVYWRNKANDVFGDMRTNVELEKRVTELANENRDLKETNGKLEKIIDLILNHNSVWNIKFLSRDEFFIWVKRTFSGVFDD